MTISKSVKDILNRYEGELPSVKLNLARLFMHGRLGGTGHIMMLAVDQGFEHGPTTFLNNPEGFSPHYHFSLAAEGGLSGYTAPGSWLRAGVDSYIGAVPMILKMNHSNRLSPTSSDPDQAVIASVQDAVDLGCVGIGFTLYPGSEFYMKQLQELSELVAEARACGLFTVVWAYPRGSGVTHAPSTDMYENKSAHADDPRLALDNIAYSAHMACLAGAHIVKVNLPQASIARKDSKESYTNVQIDAPVDRVKHIVNCCFSGSRAVIFSGGATKDALKVLDDVLVVKQGGGTGSIIGRNIFQRPRGEALSLIERAAKMYEQGL
jgi:class I fructose-bisphosphate aldolase